MPENFFTSDFVLLTTSGSLCGVSDVSITTKTVDDKVSTTYSVDQYGKVMNTKPSHWGQGLWSVLAVSKSQSELKLKRN